MKRLLLIMLLISVALVSAENPPSLTDFQVFYGAVENLPTEGGPFKVEIHNGIRAFRVSIESNRYTNLKVDGNNMDVLRFYIVDSLGTLRNLNESLSYEEGAVTKKNLAYSRTITRDVVVDETNVEEVSVNLTDDIEVNDTDLNESEDEVEENETVTTRVGTCRQNWECGDWGSCFAGESSRTCRRVDDCDAKMARDEIIGITSVPRPSESKSCTTPSIEVAASSLARVCESGQKQCKGLALQQCSFDGSRWNKLETCKHGCDPLYLRCKEAPVFDEPVEKKPAFPWMIIVIVALVVLLAGVGVTLVLLKAKKLKPGKEYVKKQRGKGVKDAVIKSKLLSQGWDLKTVKKLME